MNLSVLLPTQTGAGGYSNSVSLEPGAHGKCHGGTMFCTFSGLNSVFLGEEQRSLETRATFRERTLCY